MKLKRFEEYILSEDDHLIAINKPAGISSLHDRFGTQTSIQEMAERYCTTAQLCHRIDKETSGLLVIAKTPDAYRAMSIAFEKREVQKTYLAIAQGRHYFDNLVVDLNLSVSSRGKAKLDKRNGKEAKTSFTVTEHFRHFSLVECHPVTGRLHQIRIHLASQNAPIAGDTIYGGELPYLRSIKRNFNLSKEKEERPMISRTALHAEKLEFELFNKRYELFAEIPKDMSVFLTLLRKYDAVQ